MAPVDDWRRPIGIRSPTLEPVGSAVLISVNHDGRQCAHADRVRFCEEPQCMNPGNDTDFEWISPGAFFLGLVESILRASTSAAGSR